MAQALYRTYRSKTLADMVGQEHVTEALHNAIQSGRISHAYLFTGPKGVGKTSAARILAHEINNLPYDDSQHLDIIEIDAASNRRIDDIRDLRDKVHIAPAHSKFKVYIIDEVHMLTGESFNALLKTLEEPPAHVVFILATTEAHKLPATIISRTQRFTFRLISPEKVIAHLSHIAEKEGIKADKEALKLIAEYGEGSFRDSINLLDQLANITHGKIDAPSVEKSLGLASHTAIASLIDTLRTGDFAATNQQLTALENQGANTVSLVPQLMRILQEEAVAHTEFYGLLDSLLEVPRSYNPRLKLRTTLVLFALGRGSKAERSQPAITPKEQPRSTTKPTPVATKPVLRVEAPPQPKPQARPQPEAPVRAKGDKLSELTPEQWAEILNLVKQESAPLYGMLRQGQPDFDADTQTLTLRFRFTLHQKRVEDAKSKKLISDIMLAKLGGAPIIRTMLDTTAIAPDMAQANPAPLPDPKPVANDITKAVIDMMGGGEVVHA